MFRTLHDPVRPVTVQVDGIAVVADAGETVAAVLLRQSGAWSRTTPISGARRGPYCMMGACFDCLAEIDGVGSIQTCLIPVRDGMIVRRQAGRRDLAR